MDTLLQRHCAKYIYVVPDGLRELMSDISREVLRSNPENIYLFIADYLDALLITRENARVAAKFVESITQIGVTIAELLMRTGMTREEANKIVVIIQIAFRKHLAEKAELKASEWGETEDESCVEELVSDVIKQSGISSKIANEAANIIQNAWRSYIQQRQREHDLLRGMIDWRVAARSTLRLYRKSGVTYEEANRAATLIKAAYKGYYTRRLMKLLVDEHEVCLSSTQFSVEEEESLECFTELCETKVIEEPKQEVQEFKEPLRAKDIEKQNIETAQTIAASIIDSCLKMAISSTSNVITTLEAADVMEQMSEMEENRYESEIEEQTEYSVLHAKSPSSISDSEVETEIDVTEDTDLQVTTTATDTTE